MHWWPQPLKQHIFPPEHPPPTPQSSAQRPKGPGLGQRDMHWWPHPLEQHIFPPEHPPPTPQSSAQRPKRPGLGQPSERRTPPGSRFSTASRLTAVNDIKAKHTNDWLNVRKMDERRNDIHSTGFCLPLPCNFLRINPPSCRRNI